MDSKIFNLTGEIIYISLPEGKTQFELVFLARNEIRELIPKLYGTYVKLHGRITTGMALMLGHELAHVVKSVSIFDPKENDYIVIIYH